MMGTRPRRGALIALEGLDRAGKSTQCDLLVKRLESNNHPVHLQKFPDRTTPIGQLINSYLTSTSNLDDHTIHLLFSANRWELAQNITALVAAGTTVILDRYIYSGTVFSAAKSSSDLSIEWCHAPDVGLPRPDIIIFLNLSPESAAERGGFGAERYETSEIQERVRGLFKRIREEGNDRGDWRVVDAGESIEQVAEEVWSCALEGMDEAGVGQLRVVG